MLDLFVIKLITNVIGTTNKHMNYQSANNELRKPTICVYVLIFSLKLKSALRDIGETPALSRNDSLCIIKLCNIDLEQSFGSRSLARPTMAKVFFIY